MWSRPLDGRSSWASTVVIASTRDFEKQFWFAPRLFREEGREEGAAREQRRERVWRSRRMFYAPNVLGKKVRRRCGVPRVPRTRALRTARSGSANAGSFGGSRAAARRGGAACRRRASVPARRALDDRGRIPRAPARSVVTTASFVVRRTCWARCGWRRITVCIHAHAQPCTQCVLPMPSPARSACCQIAAAGYRCGGRSAAARA